MHDVPGLHYYKNIFLCLTKLVCFLMEETDLGECTEEKSAQKETKSVEYTTATGQC